jgi:hypothetical protein
METSFCTSDCCPIISKPIPPIIDPYGWDAHCFYKANMESPTEVLQFIGLRPIDQPMIEPAVKDRYLDIQLLRQWRDFGILNNLYPSDTAKRLFSVR